MRNNTTDLAEFGMRELKMARDLLDAWLRSGLPDDFDSEGVAVMHNPRSNSVFLTNAEYQVAVIEYNELVSFYSSPYYGYEGTLRELNGIFNPTTWNAQDTEWLEELCKERLV